MEEDGVINITVDKEGKLSWGTNMDISLVNFYLDQVKLSILTGEAKLAEEWLKFYRPYYYG